MVRTVLLKRTLPAATFFGICLALLITSFLDKSGNSALIRGDLPAFYSAAKIISSQQSELLYDVDKHRQIQNEHWPQLETRALMFSYPAYVAIIISPISKLSAEHAKILSVIALMLMLFFSAKVTTKLFPKFEQSKMAVTACFFAFAPMLSAVVGSQNTAISLLLLTCAAYALKQNDKKSDILAGICIGLWHFKPHIAGIFLIAVLLAKRYHVVLAALVTVLSYLALTHLLIGSNWIFQWIENSQEFFLVDTANNRHQMVSLYGFGEAVKDYFKLGFPIGVVLQVTALALLVDCYLRIFKNPEKLQQKLLLLVPVVLLASTHILYYELGLLLLPLAAIFNADSNKKILFLILGLLLVAICVAFKGSLPAQPLIILSLGTWYYLRTTT